MEEMDKQCPLCGHQGLLLGYTLVNSTGLLAAAWQPVSFIPAGKRMWRGYQVAAFACLECGFVGQLLSPDAVQKLREWAEKQSC